MCFIKIHKLRYSSTVALLLVGSLAGVARSLILHLVQLSVLMFFVNKLAIELK